MSRKHHKALPSFASRWHNLKENGFPSASQEALFYFHALRFGSHPKGDSTFTFAARSVRLLKSKGQRYLIWLSQGGHCAICGTFVDCDESYHIDHMKAWSKGGATELYNLQLLCPPCNLRKGARDLEESCSSGCTSITQLGHEVFQS